MNIIKRILNLYRKTNKVVRDLWLEKTLLQIPDNSKILDAGAGELQYKKYCKHLNYVSQDFGGYDGIGNSEGLQTGSRDNTSLDVVSDIIAIPVPDNSFDAVMCIEVFEHIPNPILAIKEFSRILVKGGALIITVPASSITHYAPYYFYIGFSKYFFEKFFKDYNFKITEINFNGNYFEFISQELRRIPDVFNRYVGFGGRILKYSYLLLIFPLLVFLDYASRKDKGSNTLHSTGIHVKAEKI